MERLVVIILVCIAPAIGLTQTLSIVQIDSLVNNIESDSTLNVIGLDALDVFGSSYDGGGIVHLIYSENQLQAYKCDIGLSNGAVSFYLYFLNHVPIQFVEIEKRFRYVEEEARYDLTDLFDSFEEKVYVRNWEEANTEHFVSGTRTLSEARSGIFEYEPEVEFALRLFKGELQKQKR